MAIAGRDAHRGITDGDQELERQALAPSLFSIAEGQVVHPLRARARGFAAAAAMQHEGEALSLPRSGRRRRPVLLPDGLRQRDTADNRLYQRVHSGNEGCVFNPSGAGGYDREVGCTGRLGGDGMHEETPRGIERSRACLDSEAGRRRRRRVRGEGCRVLPPIARAVPLHMVAHLRRLCQVGLRDRLVVPVDVEGGALRGGFLAPSEEDLPVAVGSL